LVKSGVPVNDRGGSIIQKKFVKIPEKILMLKGHSAGIGDILRSSAAWRALRNAFPEAELHLLLLTREPGYVSESLISRHHLLCGFHTVDKRTNGIAAWRAFLVRIDAIGRKIRPDLVIDFEPHGLRTSVISLMLRVRWGAKTVGIDQVPPRGLFYSIASASSKAFARQRGLDFPLEYTDRDFVALSALAIERQGTPIEIEEQPEGRRYRAFLQKNILRRGDAVVIGLNIGCGTPDALHRRPDLRLLSLFLGALQEKYRCEVLLAGAPFEKEVNREFMSMHSRDFIGPVHDMSDADIFELTGLIKACDLFISGDSGPYHMAVALKVPTITIFNAANPTAYHHDPWVRCIVAKSESDVPLLVRQAAELLSAYSRKSHPGD
jgi:ADP-heptose:LPS heptosyltransferase